MKKTFILLSAACLVMTACKKDRTCSCKDTTTTATTVAGKTTTSTTINDYTVVMKDVSLRTAFNACTHRVETDSPNASYSYTLDSNCEIK